MTKEIEESEVIADAQGNDDFRHQLRLQITSDATYVVMLSVSDRDDENVIRKLTAKRGVPLVPYAYNQVSEHYNVRCVDYMPLGAVPVGFQLTLPGVSFWKVRVPMPEDVLERFLTHEQKQEAEGFKNAAREANLKVEYLQMVSCF